MKPAIIPVIHYASDAQALREAYIAFNAGNEGVLIIQMEGRDALIGPIAQKIKQRWPDRLIGTNYLTRNPLMAIQENLSLGLDMTWTDRQITHSSRMHIEEARDVSSILSHNKEHTLFVGVAFKHQVLEPDPVGAANRAIDLGMVPTTSGAATGSAPYIEHISRLREGIGEGYPLAVASGVTPDNAPVFAPYLSHILVATGVSRSFHEFDEDKLRALRLACNLQTPELTQQDH